MSRESVEYARKQLNGFFKRVGRVLPAVYYTGELREIGTEEAVELLNSSDDAIVYGGDTDRKYGYMRFWVRKVYGSKYGKMSPTLALLKDINRNYGKRIKSRSSYFSPMGRKFSFRQISPEDARRYLKSREEEVYGDEGISPDASTHGSLATGPWYDRFYIIKETEFEAISAHPIGKPTSFVAEDRLVNLINTRYKDQIKPRKSFRPKDDTEYGGKKGTDRFDQYLKWSGTALTSRRAIERLKNGEDVWGVKDENGNYVQFYSTAKMRPRVMKKKRMRALKIKRAGMLDRAVRMVWNG